ncbi:MAG: toll/interleukin-1 receptor domain-containing protein [Defluviitaleaceae bacterium]|nr:toll/interleukin-1 receptor domain-containing protein [Defluviitaleaceae bacterium]
MQRVFISHSSKDLPIAEAICDALEYEDITCWIAPRNGVETFRGIRECEIFVLVLSSESNTSVEIYREVQQAFEDGKIIVALKVSDIDICDELYDFLSGFQIFESKPDDEYFDDLIDFIHKSAVDNVWKPRNKMQKPMNMRKATTYAVAIVMLIFTVSVAFFIFSDGMRAFDFDEYVSIILITDGPDFRLDVDRYIRVVNVSHSDQAGMLLLSEIDLEGTGLNSAIVNLLRRAMEDGVLQNHTSIRTEIIQPQNPDEIWLARVEYDLHWLHLELNDWLLGVSPTV